MTQFRLFSRILMLITPFYDKPSSIYCYPTALKGCQGIVFTHSVRMCGRAGLRREKVCPACI